MENWLIEEQKLSGTSGTYQYPSLLWCEDIAFLADLVILQENDFPYNRTKSYCRYVSWVFFLLNLSPSFQHTKFSVFNILQYSLSHTFLQWSRKTQLSQVWFHWMCELIKWTLDIKWKYTIWWIKLHWPSMRSLAEYLHPISSHMLQDSPILHNPARWNLKTTFWKT
jgi:hypothetical protein